MLRSPLLAAATLGAAALTPAQSGNVLLDPIAIGTANNRVSTMSSWRRPLAMAPTGVLWTLVRDVDPNVGDGRLYLTASTDGGSTWTGRFDLPTQGDGAGSVCIDRSCGSLHLAWHATDGGSYRNVYHQVFDSRSLQFVGSPQRLTNATGSNDQYFANDVVVTDGGTLVVAISTHRGPPRPWTSGWSAGLLVRPPGAAAFDPVRQVNTDTYGQRIDLQVDGEVVHAAFRTGTGGYGIRYRAYDCAAGAFTTPSDVQVDTGTSNACQIAVTPGGDLYVLYVYGGTSPGAGELRIAHATTANPTSWNVQTLAPDADLLRGNYHEAHYSLGTDGLDGVFAFYSRQTGEQHRNLYARVMYNGVIATPETTLLTSSDDDRFAVVCGVRNDGHVTVPHCIVESRAAVHPGRRVDLVRLDAGGRAVEFGVGCAGMRPTAPHLHADTLPSAGTSYRLRLEDAPASSPVALLLGGQCPPAPIDLSPFGLTGCRLDIASPDAVPLQTDASGVATLVIPLNPSPRFAGIPVLFQTLVLANNTTPSGGLTSNALTTVVR